MKDEHKLVRRTKQKEKEKVIVSRQKEKTVQEYIEQKQMPIESNKKKDPLLYTYIYIYGCTTRFSNKKKKLLLLLLLQFILKF